MPKLHRVRREAVRVALVATAIVAVVYVAIATGVVLITERNLTGEIDTRLTNALARFGDDAGRFRSVPLFVPREAGAPRFGPPLLIWLIDPQGDATGIATSATLPAQDRGVTEPRTITLGDTDVRIAGTRVGNDRIVVGQTMLNVAQSRSNVVRAELIIGPVLLVAVFLGALAIGRRVAAPIELARQRQMEFTADASHELRTPLSVIEAQTQLALAQPRDADWNRHAFERIEHESGRMRRLVEDLLWLARFDSTAGQPHAEHVDVAVLAQQAVDRFATVAESRRQHLRLRGGGGPMVVTAPPEWLDRLLGVLLDNSCKYSPEGGAVEVAVTAEGGRVRLAVEDSGPGIPEAERGRIFDRFHRASDRPGGAGLGLAIADAVVRATGGRWELGDSRLGGAAMAVSWPRGLAAQRTPAGSPAPAPPPG